jgi:protein-S-isoprenylcysteine O-methyltransferase Ste14
MKLLLSAITKFIVGIGLLGLLLFFCAGDIRYWNAWLFLGVFALCIFALGAFLFLKNKEMLQKRLNSKEVEKEQDVYTFATGISFLGIFGISGMDYRFGWSFVPLAAVIIALLIMLTGYLLFAVTLLQNSFASRIVEIQDKQSIIDAGVYSVVRHPMYTAALTMFFAAPIILGSYYALIPMAIFTTGIIFRIRNEEKVLCKGLDGYEDYMLRVRYRLIPYVW